MRMNYNNIVTYKEELDAEKKKSRAWKRAALIIFVLMVISFGFNQWSAARVTKKVEEYQAHVDLVAKEIADCIVAKRKAVEEPEEKPEEITTPPSVGLEFDLPESEWENSVVLHPDGTYRIWETKDGVIWGYGDIIEPNTPASDPGPGIEIEDGGTGKKYLWWPSTGKLIEQ